MKKVALAVVVSFFAVLMLLPVSGSVNNAPVQFSAPHSSLQADGAPIPPLPPHAVKAVTLDAQDGGPIPPLPPHSFASDMNLSADGAPIPPLPPHALATLEIA
jgi:hypothetical protein